MNFRDEAEKVGDAALDDMQWAEAELKEFVSTHDKLHTYLLAIIAVMLFVLVALIAR